MTTVNNLPITNKDLDDFQLKPNAKQPLGNSNTVQEEDSFISLRSEKSKSQLAEMIEKILEKLVSKMLEKFGLNPEEKWTKRDQWDCDPGIYPKWQGPDRNWDPGFYPKWSQGPHWNCDPGIYLKPQEPSPKEEFFASLLPPKDPRLL